MNGGSICRNLKKFLFSLKFPVKTGKKVGVEISTNFSSCTLSAEKVFYPRQ